MYPIDVHEFVGLLILHDSKMLGSIQVFPWISACCIRKETIQMTVTAAAPAALRRHAQKVAPLPINRPFGPLDERDCV
jgi:hypothetical protein